MNNDSPQPMSLPAACRAQARDGFALRRAAGIALVVGTIISFVNQSDRLLGADVDGPLAMRLLVNFLVPFIVANLGAITARRSPVRSSSRQPGP